MPIAVQHVYMDAYHSSNFNIDGIFTGVNFGCGWKLNYQQIIRQRIINGSIEYEYYDADGTNHRFITSDSGVMTDEDGLGLTLIWDSVNGFFRIKDKNKTVMFFDYHGRMFKIEDANGNVINIIYGNGNQSTVAGLPITEINDGRGRAVTFVYNGNGYLIKLQYKKIDGTALSESDFTYSSNRLISISQNDGTYTVYDYHQENNSYNYLRGKLYSVRDESDYAIRIQALRLSVETTIGTQTGTVYYDGRRVTESFFEGTTATGVYVYDDRQREELLFLNGITYSITAKNGQTFSEFSSSDANSYFSNNFVVSSVYDSYGRLVSSYINGPEITTTVERRFTPQEESSAVNNKVSASASYDSNIVNYLQNGRFEYTDNSGSPENWSKYYTGATQYYNISRSDRYSYIGQNSLEVFSAQPVSGFYVATQSIYLPSAGSYILSAYVKVSDTLMYCGGYGNDYGAFIQVYAPTSAHLNEGSYVVSDLITNDIFAVNNGFRLLSVAFTMSSAGDVWLDVGLKNCSGFAYFDGVQLIRDDYGYTDKYNAAENQGFEQWNNGSGTLPEDWQLWTNTGYSAGVFVKESESVFSGNKSVLLAGQMAGSVNLFQRVSVPESKVTASYTVSAWINTLGRVFTPASDSCVRLNYRLLAANEAPLSDWGHVDITLNSPFWHQVSATVIATSTVKKIEINIQINKSNTILLIDNVSLVQSEIVNLLYDDNGNNTGYLGAGNTEYSAEYAGNSVEISENGKDEYGVIKDASGNVLTAKNYNRDVKINYTYDSYGRVTSETMTGFASGAKKIASSTTYSDISSNWTQTLTDTDSLGFQTVGTFAAFYDVLLRTTENDGSYTEYTYTYDETLTAEIKTLKITEYDKGTGHAELSSAIYTYYLSNEWFEDNNNSAYRSTGRLRSVAMSNGTSYYYRYDKWGNVKTVYSGNSGIGLAIIDYTYSEIDGALLIKQLASGYGEKYSYDALGRLSKLEKRAVSAAVYSIAYEWAYTTDGRLIKTTDYENNKIYEFTYDASGRLLITAEGDRTTGKYKTFFENEYDIYGNIVRQSVIIKNDVPLAGSGLYDGMIASNIISSSGTYSRVRDGLYEYIRIDGVDKIRYTYSSVDSETSYIVREDNKLNNNPAFPNGSTIIYNRDARGKLIGFNFCDYNSTTALLVRGSYYTVRSSSYDYDNGTADIWDTDYALSRVVNTSYGGTAIRLDDVSYNGTEITNIIRANAAMYYTNGTSVSLVNPGLLETVGGKDITLSYAIRRESAGTNAVAGLNFLYSDGSYSSEHIDNSIGTAWQNVYIKSSTEKTVVGIILLWNYNEWVYIGNVGVKAGNNAWSSDYAIAGQVSNLSAYPMTKQPDETYGSMVITDIVRLHQASVYEGVVSGVEVYTSLVAPELLINGGDCIVLDYWARKETAGTSIRQLRFRYSDGTVSYSAGADLIDDTAWHRYTAKSIPGKVVTKIELGYNYGSWIRLGNVRVTVQGLERKDGRIAGETLINGNYTSYEYDGLGRFVSSELATDKTESTGIIEECYTYLDGNGNDTSYTITSKSVIAGANTTTYGYVYNMDASGTRNYSASNPYNIYQIKENGVLKAQYYYDTLGKLIREDNFYTNQTVTYTYDTNNNILSKTVYAVTASTTLNGGTTYTYGYSDTLHPDRLTSYDGQSIIYNGIGNPLSYLGKTLTWNGYELSSLVAGGVTYSYEYNSDGLRLKKTASNGQMTEYLRAGTQLIRETSGNNTIWYLYGQNGLIGFEYNGTSYYYVTNLQGDVMRIVDANGNVVASYVYDSWGKIIGQTGSLASVNPIRYRGYYYDQETQLYYLNARYYDPETGRFISADIVAEGGNLYAYCQNDPINRSDESGYLSAFWKKALSVAAVVVATVAVVAVATVFCGPASPYIAGAAIGAGMEMLQQIVFQDKDLSTINYAKVGVSAASGALSAIPGLGWVGAGLISAGTNAAMTAIDGGSAADIARSAAIGFVTGAVINKLFSGGMCFVEGTAVLAASGAVAIEAIAIGDLVYAYDDQTGNVALKEVVQLFRNETYELTTVRTDDGQEIISTPGHKYYTLDRDWISAVELRVGDRLLNVNGIVVIVEWIQHEIFENPVVVYNFEVKDYHTYFVAESITSPQSEFVLVHNRNCNYSKTNSGKPSGLSFNDLPDSTSVRDVLKWQNGSVKSKFPGQYLNSTIGEVRLDAKIGKKAGQTALKLLKNLRFIK